VTQTLPVATTSIPAPCTVLVVDDDREIRESVRQVLEDEGFEVATARDGGEALAYLRSFPRPGLVLLDLSMPSMDGATFCERKQGDAALASIPVVVFSAVASLAEKVGSMGVAGYLRKPLRLADLLATAIRFCGPSPGG
jgi:CheY-like chemotaxis protein